MRWSGCVHCFSHSAIRCSAIKGRPPPQRRAGRPRASPQGGEGPPPAGWGGRERGAQWLWSGRRIIWRNSTFSDLENIERIKYEEKTQKRIEIIWKKWERRKEWRESIMCLDERAGVRIWSYSIYHNEKLNGINGLSKNLMIRKGTTPNPRRKPRGKEVHYPKKPVVHTRYAPDMRGLKKQTGKEHPTYSTTTLAPSADALGDLHELRASRLRGRAPRAAMRTQRVTQGVVRETMGIPNSFNNSERLK